MHAQEASPASRMLDFEGFVTVSSVLLVELTDCKCLCVSCADGQEDVPNVPRLRHLCDDVDAGV